MKKLMIAIAAVSLIGFTGCGDDDDNNAANNGNNGTNGSNNGNNGSNNGTNGSNNGTNGSNNGTNGSNNGTNGSNNGTNGESACDTYCTANLAACPTQFATDYTDTAGCETACAAMTEGTMGDATGDTVHCRITATAAAAGTGNTDDALCDGAQATATTPCM